jgi:hypothetical protein
MQLQYEKAQRLWEKGKITKAELEALKPEAALRLHSVTVVESVATEAAVMKVLSKGVVAEPSDSYPAKGHAPVPLSAEAKEAVALLKAEMEDIDKKKAALSNSLGSYPKHVAVPQIAEQILSLRDEWASRSKMVKVIEYTGKAPQQSLLNSEGAKAEPQTSSAMQQAIIDSLPTDKYELKTKERNLVALLSKDRGKLRAAKDPAKKQELSVKIQQNEILLEAMREILRR